MAIVTRDSTPISNSESTPVTFNNANVEGGGLRESVGTVAAVSGDSAGSVYHFVRVPSNARISQVLLSADASGVTGSVHVGVYQTADNGGAVVDSDLFGSTVVITTAITHSDITHESGVFGIEDAEKPLWEALGLSEDSNRDYYISATLVATHANGGDLTLKVRYVV